MREQRLGYQTVAYRSLLAAVVVVLLISCGCNRGGSSGSTGVSEGDLLAREDAASALVQGFLDSFLGTEPGVPDPLYLSSSFNLDGFDRTQYLEEFWVATSATRPPEDLKQTGQGVELIYLDGDFTTFNDFFVEGSISPPDPFLPVITELTKLGETFETDVSFSLSEGISSFSSNEDGQSADGLGFITEEGPFWSFEVLTNPPEVFQFVVDELRINDEVAYYGTPAPEFFFTKIEVDPGSFLIIDSFLLAIGDAPSPSLPIELAVTIRLFIPDSPADLLTSGLGNTGGGQVLTTLFTDQPTVSVPIVFPETLQPGMYTLSILVESLIEGSYAVDEVVLPVQSF